MAIAELEPIKADVAYPLPLFMRLSGMSSWAMRTAKKNGLRVRAAGNRKFVLGNDWLEYLSRQA
ncbi:MAG: hypothetical protein WD847_08280 [Pirellulales bacterium]